MSGSTFIYVTYIRTTPSEALGGADRPRVQQEILVRLSPRVRVEGGLRRGR